MTRWNLIQGNSIFRLILLALLYFITGKLGLYLAIPPGYATILWPPSGIALGILIVQGFTLWPGILLGSFVLNCTVSGAYSSETGFLVTNICVAGGIAFGSTLQALGGYCLIRHFVGLPLHLERSSQITKVFLLGAPVACMIAATVGVTSLYAADFISKEHLIDSWFTWWCGDVLGVLVFSPFILILPLKDNKTTWRGHLLNTMSSLGILMLLMLLSATFYLWRVFSVEVYEQAQTKFQRLVDENKSELINKFSGYDNTLRATEAFLQASPTLSASVWKNYTTTLKVNENLAGATGLGVIIPVEQQNLSAFVKHMQSQYDQPFIVHPQTDSSSNYFIVSYLEPIHENYYAIGLNIAFEQKRLEALLLARETSKTTITERITLVQDERKTPSFLIVRPIYEANSIPSYANGVDSFKGWVYLAVLARNFLDHLTESQNRYLNLTVYEGDQAVKSKLIYQSDAADAVHRSQFKQRSVINIMQRQWLIVAESTELFERTEASYSPMIILSFGFFFSGVFALFLLMNTMKKKPAQQWLASRKSEVLPILIFLLLAGGSVKVYLILENNQNYYLEQLIKAELNKISLLVNTQLNDGIYALQRMADRWNASKRTPYTAWKVDANNYVTQIKGVRAIEWIDSSYHVRRIEPSNTKKLIEGRALLEKESTKNGEGKISGARLNLFTFAGNGTFVVYFPLYFDDHPDGFLAGIYYINDIFNQAMDKQFDNSFEINLSYGNTIYVQNKPEAPINRMLSFQKTFLVGDKSWSMKIAPTKEFIATHKSIFPLALLISSLIIALLTSLVVRFIMSSRLKTLYLNEYNEKLKKSEERYNLVVEGMGVGVWDWDVTSDEIYWSEKMKAMFGINDKSFTPNLKYFRNHLHPEDRDKVMMLLSAHLNQKAPYDIEYRFRDPKGHYSWFHACGQAKWDDRGNPNHMAGSLVDINDRVNFSIALHESINLKNVILAGAKHLIIATDSIGNVTVFNDAAERALGYTASEIIQKTTPAIWHDPKEILQKAKKLSKELGYKILPGFDVFIAKAKLFGSDESEWTFIRKNGSRFPVHLTTTALKNEEQVITGYLGVIEDITERKQIENIKNEFVSMISHELRTPITSIRASLGFIIDDMSDDLPQEVGELLSIANDNSERLILLINDMLDVNKMASGQMRFTIRKENLAELLNQAKILNQGYADKYKISIDVQAPDHDIYIHVDKDRFLQVITNFLSNAIKFSPSLGTVLLKTQRTKNSVRIIVEDKGAGISKEFRERLFTPFSQEDTSHTKDGTGLGLYICKQMIEKMNGTIGFESEIGHGTRFWGQFDLAAD